VPSPEAPEYQPIKGLRYNQAHTEEIQDGEDKVIAVIEKWLGR
jgi:hypothetical protein